MAKRLTEKNKEEIIDKFILGTNLEDLSEKFKCTKLTISRNLKIALGVEKYKELIIKNKSSKKDYVNKENIIFKETKNKLADKLPSDSTFSINNGQEESSSSTQFVELAPLNFEIDNKPQKEFSSINISNIDFPKVVYMIVDNKIELEIKKLSDYPDWQFLPQNDLIRNTIEI